MNWFKKKNKYKNVATKITDHRCWWVVLENGRAHMYDPNGNILFAEIYCEVTDKVNELPRAKFEAVVNVVTSKEEMLEKIKANEKT